MRFRTGGVSVCVCLGSLGPSALSHVARSEAWDLAHRCCVATMYTQNLSGSEPVHMTCRPALYDNRSDARVQEPDRRALVFVAGALASHHRPLPSAATHGAFPSRASFSGSSYHVANGTLGDGRAVARSSKSPPPIAQATRGLWPSRSNPTTRRTARLSKCSSNRSSRALRPTCGRPPAGASAPADPMGRLPRGAGASHATRRSRRPPAPRYRSPSSRLVRRDDRSTSPPLGRQASGSQLAQP